MGETSGWACGGNQAINVATYFMEIYIRISMILMRDVIYDESDASRTFGSINARR